MARADNTPTPADRQWSNLAWPPPGHVVTYTVRKQPTAGQRSGNRVAVDTGVITDLPQQSTVTGRILVPVRARQDPPGSLARWVPMADIITITPDDPPVPRQHRTE